MSNKKVLIAEDSSVIQNLTKKILEFQDYQIKTVKNGVDVLKTMENEVFDIVLMDINMPKMDGMECARQIRTREDDNKNVPIVAITGNAKNYSDEEFNEAGINECLTKPIDFDVLVSTVKKWTS